MPDLSRVIGDLAAAPATREALEWAAHAEQAFADEAIAVTEVPAPTFAESVRAAHVAERCRALGLEAVELGADGNVYALLPGTAAGVPPALALFVHLDTVFAADVNVTVERRNGRLFAPGVGDNAAGIAGVLGALRAMQIAGLRPERPLWIVGTVGEEGLGDLRGAKAAMDRLAGQCDAVVAVEGSFFGRLSHTAVGSRRLRVAMRADGGHSWHDFGRPSAVHALVQAAAAIARIEVPSEPRTTFNIGRIQGGTGVNVIAERAEMLLDMRSADAGHLAKLATRVQQVLWAARGNGITVDVTEVGNRPAGHLPTTHPLVRTCAAVLEHLGVAPVYAAASTDANVPLGRGIPAVTLGITRGGGAHTVGEWIEVAPMVRGVQQLVLVMIALSRRGV